MFESVKLATGPREAIIEWGKGFSVRVRSVSRRERLAISASQPKEALRPGKKGQGGFNLGYFMDQLCTVALVGWDGLTEGMLSEICEGVEGSDTPDKEIPYSDEAKSWIVERMNLAFSGFLSDAVEVAEQVGAEQLKN